MMRKLTFTIYHGLAASIAFHSALGLPLVLRAIAKSPEEPPTLVIELEGLVAETQNEEKVLQETKGQTEPEAQPVEAAEAAPPPQPTVSETQPTASETQLREAEDEGATAATPPQPAEPETPKSEFPTSAIPKQAAPKTETQPTAPGANNVKGEEETRKAQTIRANREEESNRLKQYVKLLSKRMQAHLVYPDEARQAGLHGAATVSFTILSNGQIRPESLKIVESSGQPKLDAGALKTVRSSVPFEPPPQEMTVAIAVAFGHKH